MYLAGDVVNFNLKLPDVSILPDILNPKKSKLLFVILFLPNGIICVLDGSKYRPYLANLALSIFLNCLASVSFSRNATKSSAYRTNLHILNLVLT